MSSPRSKKRRPPLAAATGWPGSSRTKPHPGFDPSLVVRDRDGGDPFAGLPLVWLAIFDRAERASGPLDTLPADQDTSRETRWEPSIARERYDASIETIREHIRAGDTYQANYTLRLRALLEADPRGLYDQLCRAQRASYNAYLRRTGTTCCPRRPSSSSASTATG